MKTELPFFRSFRVLAFLAWIAGSLLVGLPATAQQTSISSTIVEDAASIDQKDPVAILRAVDDLMNVREFDLANEFLQKFIDAKPKPKQLARAHQQLGSAFFTRLIRIPQVTELGSEVTKIVLGATEAENRDPAFINRLIDAAISKNENGRRSARSRLKAIGPIAVPYILQRFTAGSLRNEQPIRLQHALATIGDSGSPAFIGALTSDDVATTVEAAKALGHFESESALPYLLRPYFLSGSPRFDYESSQVIRQYAQQAIIRNLDGLPTRKGAAGMLKSRVHRLLHDPLAMKGNLEGNLEVWLWDAATKRLKSQIFDRASAVWRSATVLADDLYRIAPEEPTHRELFVTTQLGWAKMRQGIGQPLSSTAIQALVNRSRLDPKEANLALTSAMDNTHIPVAIAAAEVLGQFDTYTASGQTVGIHSNAKALNRAAKHAHPRVRQAAIQAILRLDPQQPFESACDVSKSLMHMATGSRDRHILIVHPKRKQATQLAGALQLRGFTTTITTNGKDGLRASRKNANLELILISDAVTGPAVSEVIQQLDHDRFTGRIPVGLLTTQERLGPGAALVQRFPQMASFPMPTTEAGTVKMLQHVLPLTDEFALTPGERLEHASWALEQMAELASDPIRYGFYEPIEWIDVLMTALGNPPLSRMAARSLGQLGTPEAQLALVEHAADANRELASRTAAAEAFRQAVDRRGIMLTSEEIIEQYEIYNSNLDHEETAAILSSIIDAIEAPSQR